MANDIKMDKDKVITLYHQLISAWNERNAGVMAECFDKGGEMIGFDGSDIAGSDVIHSHLHQIFSSHPTPPYVRKVRSIRFVSDDVAILRAIVGMVPPGKTELMPALNAHQTLTAIKVDGDWKIAFFQNTPAQYHGRPELVQQMTEELKELL